MDCLSCNNILQKQDICLCANCCAKIVFLNKDTFLHSLFLYNDITRLLILAAKINGNYKAYLYLKKSLFAKLSNSAWCADCDLIIPAPSSLWSRLYGRFDLAWLLSSELAKLYNKPHKELPASFYFKWRKNTFLQNRKFSNLKLRRAQRGANIIIFDDVVTTGATVKGICDYLPPDSNIRIITLAKKHSFRISV